MIIETFGLVGNRTLGTLGLIAWGVSWFAPMAVVGGKQQLDLAREKLFADSMALITGKASPKKPEPQINMLAPPAANL